LAKIEAARLICNNAQGSTAHVVEEVREVEKMIRISTLNDVLRPDEMKAVYDATSRELGGAGHWYRCMNGHLFTVGECGMPMQLARRPQRGGQIGGQNHQAVAGVTSAMDIERQMQNMRL